MLRERFVPGTTSGSRKVSMKYPFSGFGVRLSLEIITLAGREDIGRLGGLGGPGGGLGGPGGFGLAKARPATEAMESAKEAKWTILVSRQDRRLCMSI